MSTNLKTRYGEWALVTGASSGIGAELAKQLAEQGINIVLVARREAELKELAAEIGQTYGVKTEIISADLSSPKGVEAVKATKQNIGLLVLAAGVEHNGAFEKIDHKAQMDLIKVNVVSTFELTHHFSLPMLANKKGGILMISSLSGEMPNPYFANYSGAKGYISRFGTSLYAEFAAKGVDVSVLSPGPTYTPMLQSTGLDTSKMPMKVMEPQNVAQLGLAGLGKRPLTIPGGRNRFMMFMLRLTPTKMASKMNAKMVGKALDPKKL